MPKHQAEFKSNDVIYLQLHNSRKTLPALTFPSWNDGHVCRNQLKMFPFASGPDKPSNRTCLLWAFITPASRGDKEEDPI